MGEMEKEKELARIERGTTMMFPGGEYKQEETYIQEMSEGIKELDKDVEKEESQSEENGEEEEEEGAKCKKLVGRKRRRDRRGRLFEQNKKRREMEYKQEETYIQEMSEGIKELDED